MDFASLPLWVNIGAFCVSAGVVWIAGTRLARYADGIARTTGIGHALLGVLLLGGVTSLPEIAVAGTASIGGNAPLAVNNLLGGFAMQVAILVFADIMIRKRALTAVVPDAIVLLQGTLGILLMALVAVGISVGDRLFLGAGLWSWAIIGGFVFSLRLIVQSESGLSWQVVGEKPPPPSGGDEPAGENALRGLLVGTAIAAAAILALGYVLSSTGEAIAEQTGLGSSFFGAVFVAISTSLPEISTVLAAVRLSRYVMAVSDIFGTNLFDVALIFLVDILYVGGPVLSEVGTFSVVAALIGIVVTGTFLTGLIERRDPAVFGVGLDSIMVLVAYLGGIGLLYGLR